jgi:hypothetical protein
MQTNIPRKIVNGMWVVSVVNGTKRVGIITDIGVDGPGFCRLNLLDESGATTARLTKEPLEGLVQAKYADIPEPRRTLTQEQFAALGYI